MSVEHLDLLHDQLPELFATKELPVDWEEDFIVVRITDVESPTVGEPSAPVGLRDKAPEFSEEELLDHLGVNYIQSGQLAPEPNPVIIQTLAGSHGGAPVPYTDHSKAPPPDALAFYLPFHYYHPDWWGVYLLYEGVLWLAREIIRRSGGKVKPPKAFAAARLFLYYHEAFHHKHECFATRLELTHRIALYKEGFERYYTRTFGTDDCLEEGLANADALDQTWAKLKNGRTDAALVSYVTNSPPGYNQGNVFRPQFKDVRSRFAENNQRACLPHLPSKDPNVWRTAPHLFDGIANIKSRVCYIMPRDSPLVARLPFRPCLPRRKVLRKLQEMVGLEHLREGGRHEICRTKDGRTVAIPRHAGDLGRGLLRKILAEAGLNMSVDEFLRA